ncbi:CHRD domain-containing protein [Protofrankia symbiont of Coriaria ruscifolia]|uniref:CHRD domain-containing protein n=1 Tax=Protofrankia symbiont of Coriaria ruscifolia TaxID=1306542 RepID=UPI001F5FD86F|nr:CHRD domain-containing protein [Protofrankia symbiont of Coriaria ruscifolia]
MEMDGELRDPREQPVAAGVLIAESLRVGAVLDNLSLIVRKIQRLAPGNVTADQPPVWTLVFFGVADTETEALAAQLSEALDAPGWYVDLHTAQESFIVFPGRVIRYRRGDPQGRAEAQEYGRAHGIPDSQLDWPT